jgi:hypothetical protein
MCYELWFRKWKSGIKNMGRRDFSQSGGSRPQFHLFGTFILDSGEGITLQGKIEGYLIWRGV